MQYLKSHELQTVEKTFGSGQDAKKFLGNDDTEIPPDINKVFSIFKTSWEI